MINETRRFANSVAILIDGANHWAPSIHTAERARAVWMRETEADETDKTRDEGKESWKYGIYVSNT